MKMTSIIAQNLEESIQLKQAILQDKALQNQVAELAKQCITCLENGGKILFCGNGGSAADAQHLAAEFSGRYNYDRPPLFAEALHVNTSYLTAVANDYSFADVYSRLIETKGKPGDILIGMSTSGNSENVVRAMEEGKKQGMICVGMLGKNPGKMSPFCDVSIHIPSSSTPRIQECQMLLGHSICELVELAIFPKTS